MKKSFIYIIAAFALCLGISSCWKENLPERGGLRHQVENLVATPGDEEVALSWTMPEGWEPTDFIIIYKDTNSEEITIQTGGEMNWLVSGLVNEYEYEFSVQAVYGENISGYVKATARPTTSRFPVTDPIVDTGDGYVGIYWEKPSTLVESYTIYYYMEGDESNVQSVTVDKDALNYVFEGLTNDKNYTFTIVVNYAKGTSEELVVKAMPALAIPFFVSATSVAQGWPVTYTFNRADYETATDVTWTFPDGTVLTGDEVTYGIWATGVKNVVLNANVNGIAKEWKIEMTLREWVVEATDFTATANYNGFKGSYPVFSPDGKTVYDITFNKVAGLYAFDIESGTEKWRFVPETVSGGYNPGTVNPVTGDIYFGTTTAGQFYCVDASGSLRWTFTEAGSMQSTAPAVSADGNTVYIIDATGNAFALDAASGSKKWGVSLGKKGGSLLVNGTDLIVAIQNTEKTVQFLNTADGSEITSISLSKNATDIAGIAVADDKTTAYVPLCGGGLASIDLSTRTLIKEFLFAGNNVYAPVVASNGYVVAGSKDGSVYAVKPDLSEVVWQYVHTGTAVNNAFNYSHPCADTEGKVYITSGGKEHSNLILNAATGEIVDQYVYKGGSEFKQMGGNNYLNGVLYSAFIGVSNVNGAFIGKYVGGERRFWGGPGGDICGSGCVQSPLF